MNIEHITNENSEQNVHWPPEERFDDDDSVDKNIGKWKERGRTEDSEFMKENDGKIEAKNEEKTKEKWKERIFFQIYQVFSFSFDNFLKRS